MKILLIIPCLNEENAIGNLLMNLRNTLPDLKTLVIDDGSSDDTFNVAKEFSDVVRLCSNLGIGGAVQTGIIYAARKNYDFCIQIDGDGQHNPDEVFDLLQSYKIRPANITIGSRFIKNDGFRSTFARRVGSRILAVVINTVFNTNVVTDPTSGMRLMDRKAIELFSRNYPRDYPEPVSIALALKVGLTISETPVRMRHRDNGISSIRGIQTVLYMLRVISYVLLTKMSG